MSQNTGNSKNIIILSNFNEDGHNYENEVKQAGAELGQAQLKLELGFTST